MPLQNHIFWDILYSVLSSSRSPFDATMFACSGLASGAVRTSLEGIVDGLMSVKELSSLSNSSPTSSEYA